MTKKDTINKPIVATRSFRSAYSIKPRSQMNTGSISLTEKHHKDECDINKILSRYLKTGVITHGKTLTGYYDDVSNIGDYTQAMETVARAKELFMQLPSGVRTKFNNNPAEFLDFCGDEDNLEELQEMGLANAPKKASAEASSKKEEIKAEKPLSDKPEGASEHMDT